MAPKPVLTNGPDGDCSTAGAVQRESVDFYLDLIGAVAVMALVLLAAILI